MINIVTLVQCRGGVCPTTKSKAYDLICFEDLLESAEGRLELMNLCSGVLTTTPLARHPMNLASLSQYLMNLFFKFRDVLVDGFPDQIQFHAKILMN